jgi:hypothetical protein
VKLKFWNTGQLSAAIAHVSKLLGHDAPLPTTSRVKGNRQLDALLEKAEQRRIDVALPEVATAKPVWKFLNARGCNEEIRKLESALGMAAGHFIFNMSLANDRYEQLSAFKAKTAAPKVAAKPVAQLKPPVTHSCKFHPEFESADPDEACPICADPSLKAALLPQVIRDYQAISDPCEKTRYYRAHKFEFDLAWREHYNQ